MIKVVDMCRAAHSLRRSSWLRKCDPIWNILRPTYYRWMEKMGRREPVTFIVDGHRLLVHPLCAIMAPWESFEPEAREALRESLSTGGIVYDVGAHIGYYTLLSLACTAPTGKVVAYEPHAPTRRYLELHLEWNGGASRTIVRDVCCGAKNGTQDFYGAAEDGRPEGTNGPIAHSRYVKREVPVRTLDSEVAELKLIPSLIKVDVEGAEWSVLQGAQKTLEQHRPRLLLSLHPQALDTLGTKPQTILDWLTSLGYRHRVLSRDHEVHVFADPQN